MAMVVDIDYLAVDYFFQFFQVDHKAGDGVYFAFDGYFQSVVVAMAVSIRTLAE